MKQEVQMTLIKKEKIDDQLSSAASSSTQKPANNSSKNNNFKPHNYENTDFSIYHNQSKDVLYIAKRLQKVNISRGLIALNINLLILHFLCSSIHDDLLHYY
jgi:hypothetical protein